MFISIPSVTELSKVSVEACIKSDLKKMNEISIESKMHWNYPLEWIEKWKNGLIIPADDFLHKNFQKLLYDTEMIGFCSITNNIDNYEIEHLWLKPKFIGMGLGKILLTETISRVVKDQKDIIVVSDPNSEKFYIKQGFKTFKTIESYPPGRYLPVMKKHFK